MDGRTQRDEMSLTTQRSWTTVFRQVTRVPAQLAYSPTGICPYGTFPCHHIGNRAYGKLLQSSPVLDSSHCYPYSFTVKPWLFHTQRACPPQAFTFLHWSVRVSAPTVSVKASSRINVIGQKFELRCDTLRSLGEFSIELLTAKIIHRVSIGVHKVVWLREFIVRHGLQISRKTTLVHTGHDGIQN